MCNSELYLTVVRRGGGGLAGQSGAAVGQPAGRGMEGDGGSVVCVSAALGPLHPFRPRTRARKRV